MKTRSAQISDRMQIDKVDSSNFPLAYKEMM